MPPFHGLLMCINIGYFNHNNTASFQITEELIKLKFKWLLPLVLILTLGFNFTMADGLVIAMDEKNHSLCLSPKMVQLKGDMRKAWIDHTIWTRSYIVSVMSDRQDQKDVLDRLLRNQVDIGNLFKPYYGEAVGNDLTKLLKEHILIAGKVVDAAKKGNQKDLKKFDEDWHRNADEIAKFLSAINPNWEFKTIQDMLYTHLKLITEIVVNCLKGNWKADIAATDKNEIHMIHFADLLTEGIVKQFPDKF